MIENDDYENCKSYVKDMVQEAAAVNDIMPVYDAVIGSMLYNMRKAARLKGTDIEYDIKYDMKNIICNAFECNKIIGNLIQNAIDAVNTEEELEYGIRVAVFKRHGNTVISVSNLFDGDSDRIMQAFDMNYTTKRNHDGIGLSAKEKPGVTLETMSAEDYHMYDEGISDYEEFCVWLRKMMRQEIQLHLIYCGLKGIEDVSTGIDDMEGDAWGTLVDYVSDKIEIKERK